MTRDTRLIALALLFWGFGEGLFLYIQPLYIKQLGADPVQIGGLLSVAGVVRAASFLPAGVLADRLPRKWVMIGGWVMGLLGVFLTGLAYTWQGLIPGLVIYALSAYCIPVINTYLAHATNGHNPERTFTTVFAGYAAGAVLSPTVGGWLAEATTMRTVYFVSAAIFAASTLMVVRVSPQPPSAQGKRERRWRLLLNGRFLRFAALTALAFTAMYLGFPLAPNFLEEVKGWNVARIGTLGSFQALGTALLNPLLGGLGNSGDDRKTRPSGLMMGQALVWGSALLLLLARSLPVAALAYLLGGAYQSCRSLTQARSTALASEADRGLLLGATETLITTAQIVAPYVAGWLYAGDPTYPLVASLALIPLMLLAFVGLSR